MVVAHSYGKTKHVSESISMPCERGDLGKDLQNLAKLIEDLKKESWTQNQLVHAEEKIGEFR